MGTKSGLTHYDPLLLKSYADKLYQQARVITVSTALRYLASTFVFTLLPVWFLHGTRAALQTDDAYAAGTGISVVVMFVALMIGIERGMNRAFQLKLEAQQILCQVSIEQNTRQESSVATAAVGR